MGVGTRSLKIEYSLHSSILRRVILHDETIPMPHVETLRCTSKYEILEDDAMLRVEAVKRLSAQRTLVEYLRRESGRQYRWFAVLIPAAAKMASLSQGNNSH